MEAVTADGIREKACLFQESRILLTAYELDLFSVLEGHLLNSHDVSQRLETDERATDRLMNALTSLGYLRKTKQKFYNSEHTSQFLVKGKPDYLAGLNHTNNLWDSWSTLTDAVKKGTSIIERNKDERGGKWSESFIAAMHYRGVKQAKIISYMIDLTNVKTLLDVGGGSAAFSMGFMEVKNDLQVTVFDLPHIIPITQKYIEKEKLSDRIKLLAGDYLSDDFGGKYDLIFLSAIIHINSFEENKKLILKCAGALNEGGQIVIKDFVMEEDRTQPAGGAILALNMLVGTRHGDTYSQSEVSSWFQSAGMKSVDFKETSFGSTLVVGKKNK